AGTPLDGTGPLAALVLNNAAGNKLDYYVDRQLSYRVTRCSDRTRTVRVTVALHNGAPAAGLPRIVDVRSDHRPSTPGQSRTFAALYTTPGARPPGAPSH